MYTDMKKWKEIRFAVLRGEKSKREILRREGIHWETLKKILEHPEPPGYRLTHRCHILEANGESYRLRQARKRSKRKTSTPQNPNKE